jgi:predicted nucleotide-binding protein (sugar kinase/HSP70/actin superfamily)
MDPADMLNNKKTAFRSHTRPCVAVIGHCYNLYDGYLNMNLLHKLESAGMSVRTIEMTDAHRIDLRASGINKRMFWYFGRKAVGASLAMIDRGEIDGMLYVMAFGCGIDSFVCDYVERLVRSLSDIPFSILTIDEHTGEAGLDTRLEAFTDMIRWRNGHEADIPAYGQHLYHGQGTAR